MAALLLLALAAVAALVCHRRQPPAPAPLCLLPDDDSLRESDVELVPPHPATDREHFPFMVQAVQALDYRLRDVELAGRHLGFNFRHVFQGGCGSGFLRETLVGNDFDYMITVHLGELECNLADPTASASNLMARIEGYLGLFSRVVHDEAGPDLVLCEWPDMRGERLKNRTRILQRLAESFTALRDNRPQFFLVDSLRGRRVPCHVPEGEIALAADLMVKLLSDRIQYAPGMYPGIREIGLLFRFYVDLVQPRPDGQPVVKRNVPVNPLHSSGRVLGLHNVFIGLAPAGEPSADFLRNEIAANPMRWVRYRVVVGADLLSQVTRYLDEDKPMKALKRLHQAYDFLEPMLGGADFAELRPFLRRHLQNPDVLLCEDIRELSERARDVVKSSWLRRMFGSSGDLPRTLRRILVTLARLEKRAPPALAAGVSELKDRVEPILAGDFGSYGKSQWLNMEEALGRIGDLTASWTIALLEPVKGDMARWRDRVQQELAACGVHPFRAYGLGTNDEVGILAADLDGVVTIETLNQSAAETNVPPFRYSRIEPDQVPAGDDGKTDYFPCYLWLRPSPDTGEEARYQQALSLIEAEMARSGLWVQPP